MISKKISDRINEQINREMVSAYLYMAMSAKLAEGGYHGAAKWLMTQYHEEMFHAMKFYGYLQDQGAKVELKAIAIPEIRSAVFKDLFGQVLEHEKGVTKGVTEIMTLARSENDYATEALAQWYVNEQIEEEKNASDILQTLDLLGNSAHGIFMLNIELGKRSLSVTSNFSEMGGSH